MVMIFRDTDASIAASVYAVASALHDSLKTVVLQFTDKLSAEEILIGKGKSYIGAYDTINNIGMDALVRYQSFSTLTKEHFNMCVTPVFKTVNLLDLVAAPMIDGFYRNSITDYEKITEIITVAEAVYDNVVIVFDKMYSELAETVQKALANCEYKIIRGMKQGEKVLMDKPAVNEYFLIHDYNPASFFSLKYYRKLFNSCNVLAIPYNISFRDAYLSGDLLMFLRRNLSVDSESKKCAVKEDCNAEFIIKILEFAGRLNCRKNVSDLEKTDYENMCWEHKETTRTSNTRRVISSDNVYIKEKGNVIKKRVVTLWQDEADNQVSRDTGRVSNYMYKTNSNTLDRLLNIAKKHRRSINAELNHIVNNYIYYMEANATSEKKSEFKKASPVRKALIS